MTPCKTILKVRDLLGIHIPTREADGGADHLWLDTLIKVKQNPYEQLGNKDGIASVITVGDCVLTARPNSS